MKKLLFWDWIDQEAAKINSDGCSCVPDFYLKCCKVHDLAYYYARSPYSAYNYYLTTAAPDDEKAWRYADHITQADADGMLKKCIQECSRFGRFSPMAWWRYWALRKFGQKAWNSHASTHTD